MDFTMDYTMDFTMDQLSFAFLSRTGAWQTQWQQMLLLQK